MDSMSVDTGIFLSKINEKKEKMEKKDEKIVRIANKSETEKLK